MRFYRTLGVFALLAAVGSVQAAAPDDAREPAGETQNASAATTKPADSAGFEKYKTIVDRMPFGPEPANFNPDAPGTAGGGGRMEAATDPAADAAAKSEEEQKILASVRISALNVTPSGKIAVGFTDSSKQPAGTYYLKVGESRDGWTVKAADAREMKVTLARDGVEATLGLGEGSEDGKGKDAKAGGAGAARAHLSRLNRAGLLRPAGAAPAAAAPAAAGGGSAFANLRARRAQRDAEQRAEAERQAAAAAQAKAERERAAADREQAAAEREQQRETLLAIQEELRQQRAAKAEREQQTAEQPQE